jgi:hypothetical protein
MADEVIVVIIPGDAAVPRTDLIRKLFSDPLFKVVAIEPKVGNKTETPGLTSEQYYELCAVRAALLTAERLNSNAPCIVIKDTSVSVSNSNTITKVVKRSLAVDNFDLCYLCKWLDMCQLYNNVGHDGPDEKVALMKTKSPRGVQAILFSVNGRGIVLGQRNMANGQKLIIDSCLSDKLNEEIFNCNISAICTVPNVIEFDIALNATSNRDFSKINECVPVRLIEDAVTSSGGNLIGFLILVGLILLVAWALIRSGPRR